MYEESVNVKCVVVVFGEGGKCTAKSLSLFVAELNTECLQNHI